MSTNLNSLLSYNSSLDLSYLTFNTNLPWKINTNYLYHDASYVATDSFTISYGEISKNNLNIESKNSNIIFTVSGDKNIEFVGNALFDKDISMNDNVTISNNLYVNDSIQTPTLLIDNIFKNNNQEFIFIRNNVKIIGDLTISGNTSITGDSGLTLEFIKSIPINKCEIGLEPEGATLAKFTDVTFNNIDVEYTMITNDSQINNNISIQNDLIINNNIILKNLPNSNFIYKDVNSYNSIDLSFNTVGLSNKYFMIKNAYDIYEDVSYNSPSPIRYYLEKGEYYFNFKITNDNLYYGFDNHDISNMFGYSSGVTGETVNNIKLYKADTDSPISITISGNFNNVDIVCYENDGDIYTLKARYNLFYYKHDINLLDKLDELDTSINAVDSSINELDIRIDNLLLDATFLNVNITDLSVSDLSVTDLSVTQISSNLIPSSNNTLDLGSTDKAWKDLYLSNGYIYMGGQQIISRSTNGTVNFYGIANFDSNVTFMGDLIEMNAANIEGGFIYNTSIGVNNSGITSPSGGYFTFINAHDISVDTISVDTISAGTIIVTELSGTTMTGDLIMGQNDILDVSMISVDTISAGTINVLNGNINMDQNNILDVSMISVDTISAGTINVLNGNLNMDQNNILDVSMISVDTISAGTINVLNGNLMMYQNDILDVSLFNVKNIDMLNPTNNDKGNITNVNRIYLWSLESVTTGPTGLITVLSDLNMNSKNISNTNTITTTNLTTTNLAGTTMTGDLNMGTNTLNYNLGNINETDWDNIINITTILGNNTRNIVHRVKGKDGDDLEYEINREGSLGDQDTLSLRGWDTINLYALPEYNQQRGIHMHGYVNFNSGVKMVSGNLNMNSNDILNTKSITTTNLAGTTMTGDLNMGGNTIYADTIRCNYIKPWNLFDWHDNTDSYIQMGHTNGDDRIFIIQDASTILSVVTSDDRLKHNEIDIYNGLNIIRQLVPQKYQKTHDLKDADYMGDISGEWRWESGFIAQDVLQIPDLSYCVTGGDYNDSSGNLVPSTYYLSYNDIFVYGLAATKELDQQVQSFQTIITDLSSEVLTLKQENANLYTQNNNLTLELNIIKMALNELLNDAGKNTV